MNSVIKVCGLRTPSSVETAIEAGADMIGFVFVRQSPRFLAPEIVPSLCTNWRSVHKVGLFVDFSFEDVEKAALAADLSHLQFHGLESADYLLRVKKSLNLPIIKAKGVNSTHDLQHARQFEEAAELMLFDAKPAGGETLPGGNGRPFDWTIFGNAPKDMPSWLLSGGLTPDNVSDAIEAVSAVPGFSGVDVSSGIEHKRGEKDDGLIRSFIENARAALSNCNRKGR